MSDPLPHFTAKKTTTEKYVIRCPDPYCWGIFYVDMATNAISIISDYGNYSNVWGSPGENFKKFLTGLDKHYLLEKLHGYPDVLDGDATVAEWKTELIKNRMEDNVTMELAREVYDALGRLDAHNTNGDMLYRDLYDSPVLSEYYCDLPYLIKDYPSDLKGFYARVWPMFVRALKAELRGDERGIEIDESYWYSHTPSRTPEEWQKVIDKVMSD